VWSTGGLVLVSCAIPLLATAVLTALAFAEGEPDPAVRAFVATTVAYLVWLVLQVAVFAASFVGYVPERYLVTAAPLAFLGLCTWVARGAPRPLRVLVPVVATAAGLVAVISPSRLFADTGVHDLLTPLAFRGLAADAPDAVVRAVVVGAVLAGAAVVALVPRRRAGLVVVAAAAVLAALSAGSAREIAKLSQQEEAKAFGTADRDWIERAAAGRRVVLLNTGDREWPIVPRTQFWNANVVDIARLPDAPGSGAIPQEVVDPGADGVLRAGDGSLLEDPFVAAPAGVALAGEKVAEIAPTSVAPGLGLWRVSPPARLETSATGLGANGDFGDSVYVTVYACGPGRLELTLLGKSGAPIEIRANGIPRLVVKPPPGGLWQGSVRTPPGVDGRSICVYELSPSGPAGSTHIAFVRDG
jgi:hypothetical protein